MSQLVAHRGLGENKLSAFSKAYALGFEVCECDFWETGDGELAVCHDETIACMVDDPIKSNPLFNAAISTLSYAAISRYVSTLSEVIEIIPQGKILLAEIKARQLSEKALENLKNCIAGKEQRLIFISFHEEVLSQLRKAFPIIHIFLLTITQVFFPKDEVMIRTVQDLWPLLDRIRAQNFQGVGVQLDKLPLKKADVQRIHEEYQLKIHAWYDNDGKPYPVAQAKKLVANYRELGIDYINVDTVMDGV